MTVTVDRYQHLVRNDADKQRPAKMLAPWQADSLFSYGRLQLHLADVFRLLSGSLWAPGRSNATELSDDETDELRYEMGKCLYELTALANVMGFKLDDLMGDWIGETQDPPRTILPSKKRIPKKEPAPTNATQEVLL